MNSGFITIHRKLLDSYLSGSSYRLSLWIHLLMMASHKDKEFMFNGEKINLKRGEFITGRKVLSHKTGMSETYVTKLLKEFEKNGMLCQQTSNRNRLIAITNYNKYQSKGQRSDNGVTTECQQSDTINNVNNINNVNKGAKGHFTPPLLTAVVKYCKERKNDVDPERFMDHYTANGWFRGKTKIKDWKACVRTWEEKGKKQTEEDYFKGRKAL